MEAVDVSVFSLSLALFFTAVFISKKPFKNYPPNMESKRSRLDRFISKQIGINRRDVRLMLAQKRILLDGQPATDINQPVDEFTHIQLDQQVLQNNTPVYLMLHKPIGVVTAVKDDQHKTVIDLIDHEQKNQLHHVGRLDLNTSGLLLLTNDGRWSKRLTGPEHHVTKRYHVTLAKPVTEEYVRVFKQGIYFAYEDATTRPAELEILNDFEAIISLTEGRYHQIKRMFGHFRNEVVKLHRLSVGDLKLDANLLPGEHRLLNCDEVEALSE